MCNALEYIWSRGGAILQDGRVFLDSPENQAARQFMRDVITKHRITPEFVTTLTEKPAREFFTLGKALMYALLLTPWAIPTVVSACMWEWMYNAEFGVLNYLLGVDLNWLGSPQWAMHAAIVMEVWKSTPFVVLLLLAGLQNLPQGLYHAAAIDGASGWQIFWRITLPLLKPLIVIVLIFRTIDAFGVFDAIYVLTGGGPANSTETLSIYTYKVLFQMLEFVYGSALAVSVLLCTGFATLLYVRLLRRGLR